MGRIFSKNTLMMGIICLIIGFMVAVLFNTNKIPDERDTRDTWEIRTALLEEQKNQQSLYEEIANEKQILQKYQQQSEHQQINSLKESIEQLREEAGLTEKKGEGILLTLEPLFLDNEYQMYPTLNAELLQLFINELNVFGARDIAIDSQRIIATTPIRDVNGKVYVNHTSIGDLPINISILASDQDYLMKQLEVSEMNDYFALENISIHAKTEAEIRLPKYDGSVNFKEIDIVEAEEGE